MKTKIMALVAGILTLSSCGKVVDQGQIGIIKSWGGQISTSPKLTGFELLIFDSMLIVDGTQVRVNVDKIQPKDKDNVLLEDVSLTTTYHIVAEQAPSFYIKTKEVDHVEQNGNNSGIGVLGYQIVKQITNSAVQVVFTKYGSFEIFPKRTELEDAIKNEIQRELNTRYPETFIIDNVNAYHMKLNEKVEQMLQAQSIAKSEKDLISLHEDLAVRKADLLNKEMEGFGAVSKKSGVPVKDLMDYRLRQDYNKVMMELSRSNPSVQVKVENSGK